MVDFEILDLEEGSGTNSSRCLVGKVIHEKSIKSPIVANILMVA